MSTPCLLGTETQRLSVQPRTFTRFWNLNREWFQAVHQWEHIHTTNKQPSVKMGCPQNSGGSCKWFLALGFSALCLPFRRVLEERVVHLPQHLTCSPRHSPCVSDLRRILWPCEQTQWSGQGLQLSRTFRVNAPPGPPTLRGFPVLCSQPQSKH